MWPDQRTAYAVFLVVACEALKPSGKRYDQANVYDVVASLITPSEGELLRGLSVPPQRVRSKHVHRGELWLESELRLGPPSKHPTDALLGPQVLIVDAIVEGIGQQGVNANFETRLHEARLFLSVVLGLQVTTSKFEREWVCHLDERGRITDCRLGHVGYAETSKTREFPSVGNAPSIARREVSRPGLGPTGIWPDMREQWVPADIEDLWRTFSGLPAQRWSPRIGQL